MKKTVLPIGMLSVRQNKLIELSNGVVRYNSVMASYLGIVQTIT